MYSWTLPACSYTHTHTHSLLNFLWWARALQGRLWIQCSFRDSSMAVRQIVPIGHHRPASDQTFPLVPQTWAHIQSKHRTLWGSWSSFQSGLFPLSLAAYLLSQQVCLRCLRSIFYAWVRGTQLPLQLWHIVATQLVLIQGAPPIHGLYLGTHARTCTHAHTHAHVHMCSLH